MTRFSDGAEPLLLDTSVFFRFQEAGQLLNMSRHLGERAHITLEVDGELNRNKKNRPELKTLDLLNWPIKKNRHELPSDLKSELLSIKRAWQTPEDHPDKHEGEISTVLFAQRKRMCIVMDDGDGKKLALRRSVQRISTAMLAAEMVVDGTVGEREGFKVFDKATPPHVGELEWARTMKNAKVARPPMCA